MPKRPASQALAPAPTPATSAPPAPAPSAAPSASAAGNVKNKGGRIKKGPRTNKAPKKTGGDGRGGPRKKKFKSKEVVTYDDSDPNKPFPVGLRLYCERGGIFRWVEILERKENAAPTANSHDEGFGHLGGPLFELNVDDHGHPFGMNSNAGRASTDASMYYVHYSEWDRRMDEWVPRGRLKLEQHITDNDRLVEETDDGKGEVDDDEEDGKRGSPQKGKHKPDGKGGKGKEGPGGGAKPGPGMGGAGAGKPGKEGAGGGGGGAHATADEKEEKHGGGGGGGGGGEHGGGYGHHGMSEEDLRLHEAATKVKNIDTIVIGRYEIECWYYSPFPSEYNKFGKLYFCEFCLAFFGFKSEHDRHMRKCKLRHPPGNQIYLSQEQNIRISMFEVDGQKEVIYCQNLCYIAKLFLDHKTLEYDCTPFLFYILCEVDDRGCHMVGYFSKEKQSLAGYNLACILTLPCHQQKGFGKFLISFSYELSKIEKKVGSPEKPISDLGKVSYMSYWKAELCKLLKSKTEGEYSIADLSKMTSITEADIIEALKAAKVLSWSKGKWVYSMTQLAKLHDDVPKVVDARAVFVRPALSSLIHWTPFVVDKRHRQSQLLAQIKERTIL